MSVTEGYEPFGPGHATSTDNVILFENFHEYEQSIMKVQVDIKQSVHTEIVYTINFEVEVIDCEL